MNEQIVALEMRLETMVSVADRDRDLVRTAYWERAL